MYVYLLPLLQDQTCYYYPAWSYPNNPTPCATTELKGYSKPNIFTGGRRFEKRNAAAWDNLYRPLKAEIGQTGQDRLIAVAEFAIHSDANAAGLFRGKTPAPRTICMCLWHTKKGDEVINYMQLHYGTE